MMREEDRWRVPALERFGEQLRETERAQTRAAGRAPQRRRASSARAGAVIVVLALLAGVLEVVAPAGALSPVNHAPAAAMQSRSVQFDSSLQVSLNGRTLTHFTEVGELDFVTGDYTTTLSLTGERVDRRRVGDVFYGRQLHAHERASNEGWHAVHVERASDGVRVPGGYTLVDPQVVFRVLAGSHSAVTRVGQQELAGAQTTHYRLATSLAAFLSAEGGPVGNLAQYETVQATVDVWLDAKDRPRRVQASFADAARLGTATMTSVIDFANYGEPVTVRPPSETDVSRRSAASTALLADPLRAVELLLFARR
jgi:hypothetical protein